MLKGALTRIVEINNGKLESVDNYPCGYTTNLVYDSETKVVYYQFSRFSDIPTRGSIARVGEGYMSPYIGPNGKFCRFIDNQIVEIP